jgi:RNA polymerase sigma-70 factor (ECF subfamily)
LIRFTYEKSFNYEANYEESYFYEEDSLSALSEKEILTLINNLPDGYRLVFNLYVIEGYKHDEIAELLKINSGTSRSQLAKARNMLQKQILEMNKEVVR